MPQPLRWLSMLLPFALWGTAMAAMRPLLDGASPPLVAALRILPAGLALLGVAALMGRSLAVAAEDRPWLLLFALVDATLFQGLLTRGLAETGAGLGSVLIDSQPLLVALLARVLFAEAINPVGWLGLLIGLVGILCLGLPPALLRHWWLEGPRVLGEPAWSHGELWMLGAAAAMAVGTVLSRYACRRSDPLVVTGWHLLLGGIPLLVLAALGPAGALAYGLFFWFATRGDLTGFSALTFLTPVFALLTGMVLLGERLRPLQWLGAGLALVSVVLIHRRRLLWHRSDPAPGPEEPLPLEETRVGVG